jgi:hypothetical protein
MNTKLPAKTKYRILRNEFPDGGGVRFFAERLGEFGHWVYVSNTVRMSAKETKAALMPITNQPEIVEEFEL